MYEVSNKYMEALRSPSRTRRLNGTVGNVNFTQSDIVSESLIIDNKCADNDQVKIGSVYMGQLSVVFLHIDFPGGWYGKNITISESLLLGDGTWESVPLGTFHVVEANRADDGIHVTAYDNMDKFDKKFTLTSTLGTAYDLVRLVCTHCSVPMAQTEEQIKALPNGTMGFVLDVENEISTYRDLLGWVSQAVGCFATIDRSGRLELRQYGRNVVDTLRPRDRWMGSTFSDFQTSYTSVSIVQNKNGNVVVKGDEVGMTYELGANPLMQGISLDTPLQNILDALSAINYTPFTVYRSGCPAYDLGDKVEFQGGYGYGCQGCVMSYQYTYHSEYKMEGFGSNPALHGTKSKEEKQIDGLKKSNIIANSIQYYLFTNASPYTVKETYKDIIKIRFGANKDTIAVFQAEIKLNASIGPSEIESIIGNIKYIYNNVEMDYHPVETWIEGKHLLHLIYFFSVEGSTLNQLVVKMNSDGVINIDRLDINASISGQGLVATDSWNGIIEFTEQIGEITFETTPSIVDDIEETVSVPTVIPFRPTFTEQVGDIEIDNSLEVDKFDAYVYVNKRRLKDLTWGEVKNYTWGEILELFNW